MRTTLDLDDNVMRRIRRKAMEERKSLKELVNRALLRELQADNPSKRRKAYKCPTFSMGEPKASLEKATQLADSLEDEAVFRKMEVRK